VTHTLILAPIDSAHTPDSVQVDADCGHRCWIAPSGMNLTLDPSIPTTTVCARCMDPVELLASVAEHGGIAAVPGSREEVERELGKDATDRIWKRVVREDLI